MGFSSLLLTSLFLFHHEVRVARHEPRVARDEPLRDDVVVEHGDDVAVGDWVVLSEDFERVEAVVARQSSLTRRVSSDVVRAESHTVAANMDTVLVVQAGAMSKPILERLGFEEVARVRVLLDRFG